MIDRATARELCAAAAALGAFLTIVAVPIRAQKAAAEEPRTDMQWGVKIPMRDGVRLNATIFAADEQKKPQPVIFTFTPYIGDSYTDRAVYFA